MVQAINKSGIFLPAAATILFTGILLFISTACFSQINKDSTKKRILEFDPDTLKLKGDIPTVQNRFSEYEPNYIITNFGQQYFGQIKFKISFKYDLSIHSKRNKFYFALSQIDFWDFYEQSAPIREFDFTPVFFYEHRLNKALLLGDWSIKIDDYKIGYLHQSNGQAGPENRSFYNFIASSDIYFTRKKTEQITFTLDQVVLTARGWIWNMVDIENKNIADYRGYGQLVSTFKFDYGIKNQYRPYQVELNDVFTPAKAGISNELNLEFNPFIGHGNYDWVPFLYFQYFHGYAEGILNYDNRNNNYRPVDEFRMGIRFRIF